MRISAMAKLGRESQLAIDNKVASTTLTVARCSAVGQSRRDGKLLHGQVAFSKTQKSIFQGYMSLLPQNWLRTCMLRSC